MPKVVSTEPVPFEIMTSIFDGVSHYLGHKIDDVLSGEHLEELDGPPGMIHIALHSVCDALASIIELVEQGQLAFVEMVDDEQHARFELRIIGFN